MTSERTILVDGNNLLHRAHHVFVKDRQEPMRSPSGYPTGLIYGSLSMLSDWIGSISRPTRIVYFQDGTPVRRKALDPLYRLRDEGHFDAHSGSPTTLSDGHEAPHEAGVIAHILSLVGVDLCRAPDEEADDLIATWVRKNPGIHVIVSSDRDFYQLLTDDRVILYRPGVEGSRFFDGERATEDLMRRHQVHVPPSSIRMFKALTGDPSDNIKGVPHLRKKVAAPLCGSRSMEELLATGLPGFSKREKDLVSSMADRLSMNLELVTMRDDLDLGPMTTPGKLDAEAARGVLSGLGISGVDLAPFYRRDAGVVRTSESLSDFYAEFLGP